MPIGKKTCPRCKQELLLIESNFRKLRKSSYCRACERAYSRKYVQEHKDEINAARQKAREVARKDATTLTEQHDQFLREIQRETLKKYQKIDPQFDGTGIKESQ